MTGCVIFQAIAPSMKPTLTQLGGLRGFAGCVSKDSSLKRRKYVQQGQTDLLYANDKDLIQSRRI